MLLKKITKQFLKSPRDGIYPTKDELETLDTLVSPLIKKGQSLAHIYSANENEITISLKTLYNYVDDCFLTARNIDLRRRVKFKTRSSKTVRTISDKEQKCRINRTYEDYKVYIEIPPNQVHLKPSLLRD